MWAFEAFRLIAIPLCFLLFLKGFFPLKDVSNGYSSKRIFPSTFNQNVSNDKTSQAKTLSSLAPYERLILVIIDALRNDFVHGKVNYMPRTNQVLLQGHGLTFSSQVHPPTVTLPRIKAMTTGTIPGFVDVVLNFGSTALTEDNIVAQMKYNGKKIVFFGDDTWINLFPNHFTHHDGTTSFFVTDYTEVDHNVTRHLPDHLLPEADWDVMILHYLGLDHIGHMSGPNSPLIAPKLREMDGIVHQIYSEMEAWQNKAGVRSLLVVCGDHGMSDQGGHGGSSPSEILVPLIFLSPSIHTKDAVNKGLVFQTDLCPTLSLLLGLPIPLNSLGKVITDILVDYDLPQKVSVLHQNAQQVMSVFRNYVKDVGKESAYMMYKTAVEEYKKWMKSRDSISEDRWEEKGQVLLTMFSESLSLMAERVGKLSSQYDVYAMAASITLLWLLLLSLLVSELTKDLTAPGTPISKHLVLILPILGSAFMTHLTMCTAGLPSALMCSSSPLSLTAQLFTAVILASSMLHLVSARVRLMSWEEFVMTLRERKTGTEWFLILMTVGHTFTLLSSSFVEEEHQTFYFLISSVHTLLLGQLIMRLFKTQQPVPSQNNVSMSEISRKIYDNVKDRQDFQDSGNIEKEYERSDQNEERNDFDMDNSEYEIVEKVEDGFNSNLHFRDLNEGTKEYEDLQMNTTKASDVRQKLDSSKHYQEKKFSVKSAAQAPLSVILILVFLRILRRWNQTGNKWLDVPDCGDWLVNPDNKPALSLLVIFSFTIIGASRGAYVSRAQAALVNLSLMAAYLSRAATGALIFPNKRFCSDKGVLEARLSFLCIGLTVLTSLFSQRNAERHGKNEKTGYHQMLEDSNPKGRKSSHISKPSVSHCQSVNDSNSNNSYSRSDNTLSKKTSNSKEGKSIIIKENNTDSGHSFQGKGRMLNGLISAWLCFMCLVLRPHNAPVIAMMSLIEQLAVYVHRRLQWTPTSLLLYCLWMGHAFFFFQGNSNSLSTVDVSAGYVGVTEYSPTVIAVLMALSTYSGLVFWLISFLRMLFDIHGGQGCRLSSALRQSCNWIGLKMVFPLAVYCIVVSTQRFHLFVWTVFSPKLLYQGMETLVLSIFFLGLYCLKYFI